MILPKRFWAANENTVLGSEKTNENDMGPSENSDAAAPVTAPKKSDRVEVVKVLVLAVVSFVLGFGLVIFFLSPRDSSSDADLDLGGAESLS